MIFVTFDPYNIANDNNIINDSLIKDETYGCFICYEILDGTSGPIKLNNNIYYLKNCKCDGDIHKNCIDKWFNEYKSCPICRKIIFQKPILETEFKNTYKSGFLYYIYVNLCNNALVIRKFAVLFIFIYFTFEFYYTNLFNKYSYNYHSEYNMYSEMHDFDIVYLNNSY